MITSLTLAGFVALGFIIWIGLLKLWNFYEERTPTTIQRRIYTTAKNLPRDVFNLVVSSVLWSGLGALALQFLFGLVGLAGWLPNTSWALPVIVFFILGALFSFWEEPARSEEVQPRGRGFNNNRLGSGPRSSPPATTAGNVRGRTIRTYHEIK
ncbi:MAG: hypothetical protein SFX18_17690 [Pirellulales bacterium]|nr:hypothetical protein [Pirellulales bacterium]